MKYKYVCVCMYILNINKIFTTLILLQQYINTFIIYIILKDEKIRSKLYSSIPWS